MGRFVWCSPNGESALREKFLREKFTIEFFDQNDAATEFLREQQQKNQKWVVVTAGKNGEGLGKATQHLPSVAGYLVFCYTVAKHKVWAAKYPKGKEVLASNDELVTQLHKKIDALVAVSFYVVVSAPKLDLQNRNVHDGVIQIAERYTGGTYPDGKPVNLMMVLITTNDPFELQLDPGHANWFIQWKGQVRGALEAIKWYECSRGSSVIVNLVAIKGGPVSDKEAKWLTENVTVLENHYPFAAINLLKLSSIDDYHSWLTGKGILNRNGEPIPDQALDLESKSSSVGEGKPKGSGVGKDISKGSGVGKDISKG